MPIASKLTERNQRTFPAEVRRRLRPEPGDALLYETTEDGALLKVKQANLDEAFSGYLKRFREWGE